MNYSILIVKIVSLPEQTFLKDIVPVTKIQVKFVPIQQKLISNDVFTISIWGNLSYDIIKHYSINDYIIIEGYISLSKTKSTLLNSRKTKKIRISVLNIYPLK